MASPCFGEAHRIFVAQIFRNSTQTQIFLFIYFFALPHWHLDAFNCILIFFSPLC